ncbi:MAG TPA: ABC transporter permease [Thermoanaerobaculia bacterium]|jgi:peptide/nickel transport system permease protein|nr:ABC transporter permease [Thermoanaerobaculia bacterium]
MTAYLLRRLSYAVLTFFGITVATFVLIHSVPGDPVQFFLGKSGSTHINYAALEAIKHEFHLDQPLPVQYGWWLRGILTLDLGRSITDRRPVTEVILEKLPNTFQLNLIAFLLAASVGVPAGLWSASRSGRASERASAVLFFLLYSLPTFWVALLLMELFSVKLRVLPLFGMTSDSYLDLATGARLLDRLRHLVLPVITLAYAQLAIFARFSKSALTEVIRQDFITTARAKGATPGAVLWRHAFRNALIPLITLLGLTIPMLISGSVIVEQIFQWDGVGHLYFQSILSRDYPVVLGLTVATALVTLFASLFADLLYAFADPRIRLEEGRR